jgi:hypothetical protein
VLTVRSFSVAPLISAPRQVVAVVGQPLVVALLASDADQDPLRWTAEGLPLAAELTPGTQYGQATLRWTPSAADLGSHDLELIVTDSGLPPQDAGYANRQRPGAERQPSSPAHRRALRQRRAATARGAAQRGNPR